MFRLFSSFVYQINLINLINYTLHEQIHDQNQ